MKKKIIVMGVVLLFLFCSYVTIAKENHIFNIKSDQGIFNAKIGVGNDQRADLILEGNFKMRGRIRVVRGTYESSISSGVFQGKFVGNNFYLVLSARDGRSAIYGRIRVDESYSEFTGNWHGRGFDRSGWINGEFIIRG